MSAAYPPHSAAEQTIELQPLLTLGLGAAPPDRDRPTAWYIDPLNPDPAQPGLPRTEFAEAIARCLMAQFQAQPPTHEAKMYGILLVKTPAQAWGVLKAFSGLLNHQAQVAGWVPPLPGREELQWREQATLARLAQMNQELLTLDLPAAEQALAAAQDTWLAARQALAAQHRDRKRQRAEQRQWIHRHIPEGDRAIALAALDQESRRDGRERRDLKRQQDQQLQPLRAQVEQIQTQRRSLKQQRRALSQALQAQMHQTYWVENFAGQSLTLAALSPERGLPTGTGDCCAPKLLHYAASRGLTPVAIAEFWWDPHPVPPLAPPERLTQSAPPPTVSARQSGAFYLACADRCQPILGFLLHGIDLSQTPPSSVTQPLNVSVPGDRPKSPSAGLPPGRFLATLPTAAVPIVYEDAAVIVIDKPAGLLSVPGRSAHTQDSVWSRLRYSHCEGAQLEIVHRLDQATSGLLMLAKHSAIARLLRQQFQQRQVHKVYRAIVTGCPRRSQGEIHLPLWGDPTQRPRQDVDWARGKPSQTEFRVLETGDRHSIVELIPRTGRTHQLRVHAAHPDGLNTPIWGDRLYGTEPGDRLYLHAAQLTVQLPQPGANAAPLVTHQWYSPPPWEATPAPFRLYCDGR